MLIRIVHDKAGAAAAERLVMLLSGSEVVPSLVSKERFPTGDALCRFLAGIGSSEEPALLVISESPEASHWALPELASNDHLYPSVLPVAAATVNPPRPARLLLLEATLSQESLVQALKGIPNAGA